LLDFDFVNGVYRQDGVGANSAISNFITTTRASVGYADDQLGNWTSFSANTPRAVTPGGKGLLVEEARTNSIRNNSMQGAVVGSPGTLPTNWQTLNAGLTVSVVNLGTESGIDFIDVRFSGTTTSTVANIRFETNTQITAAQNNVWSGSLFAYLIGGSLTNITGGPFLSVYSRNSGGTALSEQDVLLSLTSASLGLKRATNVYTLPDATTARVSSGLSFNFSNGVAIDVTFRIGWPQLELGAFATSPIRTTNAAATRAADVVTVTNPPAFGSAYSFLAQATPQAPDSYAAAQNILNLDQSSNNNRTVLYRNSGTGFGFGNAASATYWNGPLGTSPVGVRAKLAAVFAPSDQAGAINGGTVLTNSLGTPILPTAIHIGSTAIGTQQIDGYIERIAVWPTTRLSNVNLQRVST
jgi:hypothetical protein